MKVALARSAVVTQISRAIDLTDPTELNSRVTALTRVFRFFGCFGEGNHKSFLILNMHLLAAKPAPLGLAALAGRIACPYENRFL